MSWAGPCSSCHVRACTRSSETEIKSNFGSSCSVECVETGLGGVGEEVARAAGTALGPGGLPATACLSQKILFPGPVRTPAKGKCAQRGSPALASLSTPLGSPPLGGQVPSTCQKVLGTRGSDLSRKNSEHHRGRAGRLVGPWAGLRTHHVCTPRKHGRLPCAGSRCSALPLRASGQLRGAVSAAGKGGRRASGSCESDMGWASQNY